jgi:hypothetical protein
MSTLLPQRIGHCPQLMARPVSARAQPQYEQSVLHPEQIGSTAAGL